MKIVYLVIRQESFFYALMLQYGEWKEQGRKWSQEQP